jgi:hypothetical protein
MVLRTLSIMKKKKIYKKKPHPHAFFSFSTLRLERARERVHPRLTVPVEQASIYRNGV